MGFPSGSDGKESACNVGDLSSIPGLRRSLEKGMATHSSILTWSIPWTESLVGYSPQSHKESDRTEQLSLSHFLFTRDCTFFPVKYVLELIAKEVAFFVAL